MTLPAFPAHVEMTKELAFLKNVVVSSPDLGRCVQVHSSTMRNACDVFPLHLQKGWLRGGLDEIWAISNHPCGALAQLGLHIGGECRSILKWEHYIWADFKILGGNKKAPDPIAVKCSESTRWNELLAVGDAVWWLPFGWGERNVCGLALERTFQFKWGCAGFPCG